MNFLSFNDFLPFIPTKAIIIGDQSIGSFSKVKSIFEADENTLACVNSRIVFYLSPYRTIPLSQKY